MLAKETPSLLMHLSRGLFMVSEGSQFAFYRPDKDTSNGGGPIATLPEDGPVT